MADFASVFAGNLRATISDWMPYISWSVVPVIIGLIKKYKPAWKDKVGEFWPVIAVILCILLNSIGITIKPTDLDLPGTAPPGISFQKKRTLDAMPAPAPVVIRETPTGDTGSTAMMMRVEPEEVTPLPVSPPPPPPQPQSSIPPWAKGLLFSIMGGLAASKFYDEWKLRKKRKEACKVALAESSKEGGK